MELGGYPENLQPVKLDEAVANTVVSLQEEYAKKGLMIDTELVPFTLTADPVQVERIVTNILENSLKYKNKEIGKVHIFLSRIESGCSLSFSDDGPGVPPESLPHLFEAFYRSDPSRQNPGSGSGLGLAIVANAVKRMGGTITAANNEMGGLVIRMDFPKEAANEEDTDCGG